MALRSVAVCMAGVVVVTAPASPVFAESKSEAAIAKAIDLAFDREAAFPADVVPIGPGGTIGRAGIRDVVSHRIGDERLNGMELHLAASEVPTISVNEAAGVAWFSFAADVFDGSNQPVALRGLGHRVTGIAVRDGASWKLATYMIANLVPDKELYARAAKRDVSSPAATGDLKLAATVAEWFTTGLAAHGVTSPPAIVSGSAAAEHGAGATAAKLVKAWDALKLRPTELEARVIGKLAVVSGEVALPRKDQFAPLGVTVFLVAGASGWRWVAIQFSALPD